MAEQSDGSKPTQTPPPKAGERKTSGKRHSAAKPGADKKASRKEFLFEDRVALIADLLALKRDRPPSAEAWASMVSARLMEEPILAPLGKMLEAAPLSGSTAAGTGATGTNDPQKTQPAEEQRAKQLNETIDAAIRLAERHPVAAFGRDVQGLLRDEIATAIDDTLTKHPGVRLARWGAPLLLALAFGGTFIGGVKVNGFFHDLNEQRDKLTESATKFSQDTQTRLDDIAAVEATAKSKLQTMIDKEAKEKDGEIAQSVATYESTITDDIARSENETGQHLNDLDRMSEQNQEIIEAISTVEMNEFDIKDKEIENKYTKEIQNLPDYFKEQKTNFLKAQEKAGADILQDRQNQILKDWGKKQTTMDMDFDQFEATIGHELDQSGALQRIRTAGSEIDSLNAELQRLNAIAEETRRGLAAASSSAGLPAVLLIIFTWKDGIAVAALFVSLLTLLISLFRPPRPKLSGTGAQHRLAG